MTTLLLSAERALTQSQKSQTRLKRALRKLRDNCGHQDFACSNDQKQLGIRICITCGLEEHGSWGTYKILEGQPSQQCSSTEEVRATSPFPTEIWTVCCGGSQRGQQHPVPASELVEMSSVCSEHLCGLLPCPICRGQHSWWESYGDGSGDGRRVTCGNGCNRHGLVAP